MLEGVTESNPKPSREMTLPPVVATRVGATDEMVGAAVREQAEGGTQSAVCAPIWRLSVVLGPRTSGDPLVSGREQMRVVLVADRSVQGVALGRRVRTLSVGTEVANPNPVMVRVVPA